MAIALSLLTATLFGISDFCGGLAGRRWRVLDLILVAHLIGLGGTLAASLLIADRFILDDFIWGGLGGTFGLVGLMLLYRGLARGPMSLVAPMTAVTSALVPAAWGVFIAGDVLSGLAWAGVACALVAIGASSTTTDQESPVVVSSILEALAAGTGFGLMFVALDQTDPASAPWSIVGARAASLVVLLVVLAVRLGQLRRRGFPLSFGAPSGLWLVIAVGVLDSGSNVLFLYAIQNGSLTVVSVLTSIYPVATVLLARVVLAERLGRVQQAGVALALLATVLISAG